MARTNDAICVTCPTSIYRKNGDLIMAVFEKVQEIIVEELGKDASEITLETSFESLDADSLDIFQIINEIEDEYDIAIETEDGLNTVGDLVKFVDAKIAE